MDQHLVWPFQGPGDTVDIYVGDHLIKTTFDENGTQRLPKNRVYQALLDSGALDLNELAWAYKAGNNGNKISFKHYLEFYLNIGYSVCGFADISDFQHLEIKNPVWDKK